METTVNRAQDAIIEDFSRLGDWFEQYQYLIALGREHTSPDEAFKNDRNALPGCQSRVWIEARAAEGRVRFAVDSDSVIIRGFLVLLLRILDDRTPEEIHRAHLYFAGALNLGQSLSPSRANGLFAIIEQMRRLGGAAR